MKSRLVTKECAGYIFWQLFLWRLYTVREFIRQTDEERERERERDRERERETERQTERERERERESGRMRQSYYIL